MTVAENLVLARPDLPPVLSWKKEKQRLRAFLEGAPFRVELDAGVEHLAAGQKQKVEILKQLYLQTRVLILDEPTSVLTPAEAGEVMSVLTSGRGEPVLPTPQRSTRTQVFGRARSPIHRIEPLPSSRNTARAVLIPARVAHAIRMWGTVEMRTLYLFRY